MNFEKPQFAQKITTQEKVQSIVENQIEELAEIRNPKLRDAPQALDAKKKALQTALRGEALFCLLPWRNRWIEMLPEKYFFELKTARNKNLITSNEQKKFYEKPIAIAGLSVGSNIARLCALQGGSAKMNVADADTIGNTNLNRILSGVHSIGQPKTHAVAESLYEMNPFADVRLFSQGITDANAESFLYHENKKVAVLVEEVDNMQAKIALRAVAARLRVPVVSIADNADGALVEVERYDKEYTFQKFERRLKPLRKLDPTKLTIRDKAIAITKYIGAKHIPSSMLSSVLQVGNTLFSWPQLGGAALLSGVLGAYCVRAITTGAPLKSGTYRINIPSFFGLERDNTTQRNKLLAHFK